MTKKNKEENIPWPECEPQFGCSFSLAQTVNQTIINSLEDKPYEWGKHRD